MSYNTQKADKFKKYDESGAYHWLRTHDTPFWRRGVKLLARYEIAARRVKKLVRTYASGLDVGCGDGFLIYYLVRYGYAVTGIDTSKEGLAQARSRLDSKGMLVDLLESSAYELPVQDASQDFVTSVEVIEHLEKPGKALEEINRVLKPGGVFICTTPQRAPEQAADEVRDPYHIKEYSALELQEELQTVFENVEVRGAYPAILDRLYMPSLNAGYFTRSIRLLFRLSAAVGVNPYLYTSEPAKATDQLLVGIARK